MAIIMDTLVEDALAHLEPVQEFKYGIRISVKDRYELFNVYQWLDQSIPNTYYSLRWKITKPGEIWFSSQQDRDWFLLKWQ